MAQQLYKQDYVSVQHNNKTGEAGTIDIYRGCPGCELRNAPCYAAKGATRRSIDFFSPVKRILNVKRLEKQLEKYKFNWLRIGCISDPSLDWETIVRISELVRATGKTPVIVTKLHQALSKETLESLSKSSPLIHISTSALAVPNIQKSRIFGALACKEKGLTVGCRINSAVYPVRSKLNNLQNSIIHICEQNEIPILETPIRTFTTTPIWNLVDQTRYHRHLSPISGKLDSQVTAGLIIDKAYPCFSTCSPVPTKNDPVGCKNQCLTVIEKR